MKPLRVCLCIGISLLFLTSVSRPGYRIVVNGKALPGIYDPDTVLHCHKAVLQAAEEITRTREDAPYTLVPVLCRQYDTADPVQLQGILLESYAGIKKLYAVSIGDRQLGMVSDLREVYRLKNKYLPAWSPSAKLTVQEMYTYAEAETPMADIETAFLQLSTPTLPV